MWVSNVKLERKGRELILKLDINSDIKTHCLSRQPGEVKSGQKVVWKPRGGYLGIRRKVGKERKRTDNETTWRKFGYQTKIWKRKEENWY